MTVDGGVEGRGVAPALPPSIWVLAWAALAGQVLLVARHGGRVGDDAAQVASMVLGAAVVGYVSAGVVRARRVRVVLAWVVLALGSIGGVADLGSADGAGEAALAVLALVVGGAALAGLAGFCRSDWYVWQRTRPSTREGASIRRLVVVGVLVGALGGYVGLVDDGVTARVNVDVG